MTLRPSFKHKIEGRLRHSSKACEAPGGHDFTDALLPRLRAERRTDLLG